MNIYCYAIPDSQKQFPNNVAVVLHQEELDLLMQSSITLWSKTIVVFVNHNKTPPVPDVFFFFCTEILWTEVGRKI